MHDYHEDLEVAAKALKADVEKAKSEGKALVYMWHGNEYFSTGIYAEMQKELRKVYNYPYIFVGTVEGYPSLDDVVVALKHIKVKKVLLKTSPNYAKYHKKEAVKEVIRVKPNMPVYQEPLFAEMYVMPYVSNNGIYHDVQKVYIKVKNGEWVLNTKNKQKNEKIFNLE